MRWTKTITLGLALVAATTLGGLAQARAAENGNLNVVFTGLANNAGTVRIALVNSKAGYDNEQRYGFRLAEVGVKGMKAEYTFTDVPAGTYAIKAFHDQNGDKTLNKGLFGQPLEPYGFSNNVRGTFGPPSYDRTTFRLGAGGGQMSIRLAK